MASSMTIVLFGLLFAIVLLVSSDVSARELAQETQSPMAVVVAAATAPVVVVAKVAMVVVAATAPVVVVAKAAVVVAAMALVVVAVKAAAVVVAKEVVESPVTVVTLQKKLKTSRIR
ncbi:hypothetical protein NL676_024410 [Syzygium grande]|nr:hypothetical protein NL676_024410 [Syzygium grande]